MMVALLRMLRLPNLAIVFLSQWLPYYMVLRPAILRGGGIPALGDDIFWLLSTNTVLVTLAGYIINDVFDQAIDARNRPESLVIGRILPRAVALALYAMMLVAIGWASLRLDAHFHSQNFGMTLLFGGTCAALFLYSAALKCTPVLGNLLVAALCAIVPLVVWFPERRALQLLDFQDAALAQRTMVTFWNFVIFAFAATLFREMVKDLEDHAGDAACDCRTLPVLRGVRFAKRWAALVGAFVSSVLALLILYWQQTGAPAWKLAAGCGGLILPAILATIWTARGQTKADFARASLAVKLLMLAGIALLSAAN